MRRSFLEKAGQSSLELDQTKESTKVIDLTAPAVASQNNDASESERDNTTESTNLAEQNKPTAPTVQTSERSYTDAQQTDVLKAQEIGPDDEEMEVSSEPQVYDETQAE